MTTRHHQDNNTQIHEHLPSDDSEVVSIKNMRRLGETATASIDQLPMSSDIEPSVMRAQLLRNYQAFAQLIEGRDLQRLFWRGGGASSQTYEINLDNTTYVVRVPSHSKREVEIDKHLDAAVHVGDLAHLEHIVAASYEDGVTIANVARGRHLRDLGATGLANIEREDIIELFVNMKRAEQRGVRFDVLGENLLFDAFEDGFTMLDLSVRAENDQTNGRAAESLYVNLGNAVPGLIMNGIESYEKARECREILRLMRCSREVIASYEDNGDNESLHHMSRFIVELEEVLDEWSTEQDTTYVSQ